MVRPQHECTDAAGAGWNLLAVCDDGSVGAGDVAIVVGVLVVLAAAGVGIWYYVRSRME